MSAAIPTVSMRSVVLPAPGRGDDLHVRISATVIGQELPIIIFPHGHGSFMDGYAPLTDFQAARGFVAIQPTELLFCAQMVGVNGDEGVDMFDRRIGAGVRLAASGEGGKGLSLFEAEQLPYLNISLGSMVTSALVVVGDNDHSPPTQGGTDGFAAP